MKARKMQEVESAESGVPMITPSVIACGDATFPLLSLRDIFPRRVKASAAVAKFPAKPQSARARQFRPLRRSRASSPEGRAKA